jgi:hypothetical protein
MTGRETWVRVVFVGSSGHEVTIQVVEGQERPDLTLIDVLGRWQLLAHRLGGSIRLSDMSEDVAVLLDLAGLLREMGGKPEHGKEVSGVEKGVDLTNPVA